MNICMQKPKIVYGTALHPWQPTQKKFQHSKEDKIYIVNLQSAGKGGQESNSLKSGSLLKKREKEHGI